MDATDRRDERDHRAPLYDQRFEHDACGVGFVADAGGGSHARVLPLALAGLAALAHRGAFAADGESSDGAGVAMPLSGSLLSLIAGSRAAERPGVVMLFLPRGRVAARAARALVERVFADAGLPVVSLAIRAVRAGGARGGCRVVASGRGPGDRRAAAPARRTRCSNVGWSSPGGVWRQPRVRQAVRSPGCRCHLHRAGPIVYKGLVAGTRLRELYPDLRAPVEVAYTVFHQRYATNTTPVWRLAQPFRSIAHNGEINTVRGNREQVRGRTRDRGGRPIAAAAARRRIAAVAGRLRLAVARRGPGVADDDRVGPRPGAAGRDPRGRGSAPGTASARGDTASPDRRHARAVGRPGRHRVRRWTARRRARRPERASPGGLRGHDGSDRGCRHRKSGAVPFAASETVRRGRLGPGEMLLVEPGRRAILEDTDAKARVLRHLPIHDAPRPLHEDTAEAAAATIEARPCAGSSTPLPRRSRRREGAARHQDDGPRGARAALEHGRRHADGRVVDGWTGPSPTTCGRRSRR